MERAKIALQALLGARGSALLARFGAQRLVLPLCRGVADLRPFAPELTAHDLAFSAHPFRLLRDDFLAAGAPPALLRTTCGPRDVRMHTCLRCFAFPAGPAAADAADGARVEVQRVVAALEAFITQPNDQRALVVLRWLVARGYTVLIAYVAADLAALQPSRINLEILSSALVSVKQFVACPTYEGALLRFQTERLMIKHELALAANKKTVAELSRQARQKAHEYFEGNASAPWAPPAHASRMKEMLKKAGVKETCALVKTKTPVELTLHLKSTTKWLFRRSFMCHVCSHPVEVVRSKRLVSKLVVDLKKNDHNVRDIILEVIHYNLCAVNSITRAVEIIASFVRRHNLPYSVFLFCMEVLDKHSLLAVRSLITYLAINEDVNELLVKHGGTEAEGPTLMDLICEYMSTAYRSWDDRRRSVYFFVQFVVHNPRNVIAWEWLKRCFHEAVFLFHNPVPDASPEAAVALRNTCLEFVLTGLWMVSAESESHGLELLKAIEEREKAEHIICRECVSVIRCFAYQAKFRNRLSYISRMVAQNAKTATNKTLRMRDLLSKSLDFDSSLLQSDSLESEPPSALDKWLSSESELANTGEPFTPQFPLPLSATHLYDSLNYERSVVVRSSKYPILVDCNSTQVYNEGGPTFPACNHHVRSPEPLSCRDRYVFRQEEELFEEGPVQLSPASRSDDPESSSSSSSQDEPDFVGKAMDESTVAFKEQKTAAEEEMEAWNVDIESLPSSPPVVDGWEDLAPTCAGLRLLYKTNDDLRQDCFVVDCLSMIESQIFGGVYNLQTHLSRYRVLPLSTQEGFIEYVDNAMAFSSLGGHNPPLTSIINTKEQKIKFMESLAAHCVATFILGVGDRHLDNLMLTRDGRMFHVDYGFILGNDPKPFARVPMRLTTEMSAALGGVDSHMFITLVIRVITLWFSLRKQTHDLKLLFSLVANTDIQDIRRTRLHMQTKYPDPGEQRLMHMKLMLTRLNFSRDDVTCMKILIYDVVLKSISSLGPTIADYLHNWVVYFR